MSKWIFVCEQCKKECEKPKRESRNKPRFCGKVCYKKSRDRSLAKNNHKVKCEGCGKSFETYRSSKQPIPKFCSYICRGNCRKSQWKNFTESEKRDHMLNMFERCVIKGGDCWGWLKSKDKNGYGVVPIESGKGVPLKAHQLSWWLNFGEIPKGHCVLHKCDNPICSNPEHLFLGTNWDNTQDMLQKGRNRPLKGEKNHRSKLTEKDVREIKKLIKSEDIPLRRIASFYNVEPSQITLIKQGKAWKHVVVK